MQGLTIVLALLFPVGCLLMILLLDRLEETLDEGARPAPVVPQKPAAEPAPVAVRVAAQASERSRSLAVSLGGVTNR